MCDVRLETALHVNHQRRHITAAIAEFRNLATDECRDAGVLPGVVRISVGIEDPEDIVDDLDQALTQATKG